MNSPLSSPCSEGTDPYSLDEIEEKAEQHTSDDDMESPLAAQYVSVTHYRVLCRLSSSIASSSTGCSFEYVVAFKKAVYGDLMMTAFTRQNRTEYVPGVSGRRRRP